MNKMKVLLVLILCIYLDIVNGNFDDNNDDYRFRKINVPNQRYGNTAMYFGCWSHRTCPMHQYCNKEDHVCYTKTPDGGYCEENWHCFSAHWSVMF